MNDDAEPVAQLGELRPLGDEPPADPRRVGARRDAAPAPARRGRGTGCPRRPAARRRCTPPRRPRARTSPSARPGCAGRSCAMSAPCSAQLAHRVDQPHRGLAAVDDGDAAEHALAPLPPMDVVVIGMRTPLSPEGVSTILLAPDCSRRCVTAGLLTSARTTLVRRGPGILDAHWLPERMCQPRPVLVGRIAAVVGGALVVLWTLSSAVQTVVVPRAGSRSRSPACTSAAHVSCSSSSPVRRGRTRPVTGSSPCTPRSRSSCSPPCGRRSSRSGSPRSSGAPGSTRCTRRSPRPARRCSPSASIARMAGGGSR